MSDQDAILEAPEVEDAVDELKKPIVEEDGSLNKAFPPLHEFINGVYPRLEIFPAWRCRSALRSCVVH